MAGGWTRAMARCRIRSTTWVLDAVLAARARLAQSEGTEECVECGEPIPATAAAPCRA